MSFDTLTAIAIRSELEAALVTGRVQKVLLPDPDSVALEIYAARTSYWLLLSVSSPAPRVHLVSEPRRRGVERETPLLLLLRKFVRGGRIQAVRQPPLERVLEFHVSCLERKSGQLRHLKLIAEIMGRHSNLVLVDEAGTVMDSLKRVAASINRYRQILPHLPYRPPPPLSRPHPARLAAADLHESARRRPDDPAWQVIVGLAGGVSPLLAREVLFRSCANLGVSASDVPDWEAVLRELQDIFAAVEGGAAAPTVAFDDGGPVAFAPYELTQFRRTERFDSMSAAIDFYCESEPTARPRPGSPRRQRVRTALLRRRDIVARRIHSLELSISASGQADEHRRRGEAILAHLSNLRLGSSQATLDGDVIDLNPALTPLANAQAYFRRYRSAKHGAEKVPPLVEKAKLEAQFLEQSLLDLELADSDEGVAEIEGLLSEQAMLATAPRKRAEPARAAPRSYEIDGWRIYVGRNAAQNETATFRIAAPEDLWLHARAQPGAHVIIRQSGQQAPESIIVFAAAIAARHSAAGSERAVDVDATLRRNVKRISGGRPGQVTYRGERTLRVAPADLPADLGGA